MTADGGHRHRLHGCWLTGRQYSAGDGGGVVAGYSFSRAGAFAGAVVETKTAVCPLMALFLALRRVFILNHYNVFHV